MTKRIGGTAILSSTIVALVSIVTVLLVAIIPTPSIPTMRTVDVFDTTLANGYRWIVASVETNVYDSLLVARYVTMLYHRMVPKHLDDTGAVQLEAYFYAPEDRRALRSEDVAMLARYNPAIGDRLGKLSAVDSAYVGARFSSPWLLFGRDTLIVVRTRIYLPSENYRWASLIRRPH